VAACTSHSPSAGHHEQRGDGDHRLDEHHGAQHHADLAGIEDRRFGAHGARAFSDGVEDVGVGVALADKIAGLRIADI
jgi:hypothetical protein